MGTVFRAYDVELEENLALKILRRELIEVPGTVERFRREVKLARRVTHRNVARVFDIGEHEGDKFLTMELVEGEALAEVLRRGLLSPEEATRICLQIVEGLAAAHAAGVTHRDLKPENVLIAKGGRVVITDFGIARAHIDEGGVLRTMGAALGTPAYMAPEQVEPDRDVDARADIYSFGAVMFEMFTGRRAWPGESPIAVAAARLLQPPPDPLVARPELPVSYARIITRCLARKPVDRFPSAEAIAMALRLPNPWLVEGRATPEGASDPREQPTLLAITNAVRESPNTPTGAVPNSASNASQNDSFVASSNSAVQDPNPIEATPLDPREQPHPQPGTAQRSASVSATLASANATGNPTGSSNETESREPSVSVGSPRTAAIPPSDPTSLQPSSAPKTVAVLPFRNAGGLEDDYLADGLTDELIDTLSMTPGLRVRSRGVVMQHKGADSDPRELGRRLDVGLVVEGSVRRTSAGVRITARVVSVADGSQLWAKRFDRNSIDVFVVSDEVARAVAEALTLEETAPARDAPADPIAMELYLKGRQQYRSYLPDNIQHSVSLFEQALARAPDHPTLLSAYALACARLWWFGNAGGSLAGENARKAAERALASAPHLGEPHLALSQVMWNAGDALGAAREIQRAISRGPTLAEAHALRGRILVEAASFPEGIKSLTTAISLEPNVPLALGELTRAHALLGNWDQVSALAEHGGAGEGPLAMWFSRARYTLWRRDREGAGKWLTLLQESPRVPAVARWLFEQTLTQVPPAETIDLSFFIPKDEASARRRSFILQMEAEVRCYHRQFEPALSSIERSLDDSLFDFGWLQGCPLLAPIREAPRFKTIYKTLEDRVRPVLLELNVFAR